MKNLLKSRNIEIKSRIIEIKPRIIKIKLRIIKIKPRNCHQYSVTLENVCYHRIDCNTVQLLFIDDQKFHSSLIVGVRLSVRFSIWASPTKILHYSCMLENVCYHRIDCNTVQLSFIDDQKVHSSLIVGVRLSVRFSIYTSRKKNFTHSLIDVLTIRDNIIGYSRT